MDDFFLTTDQIQLMDPDAKLTKAQRKRLQLEAESARDGSLYTNVSRKRKSDETKSQKKDNEDDPESDQDQDVDNLDLMDSTNPSSDEEEDIEESAAQKRLRLAKRYLSKVQEEYTDIHETEIDAATLDREIIADRLRTDAMEAAGKVFTKVADKFLEIDTSSIQQFGDEKARHKLAVTCLAVAFPDEKILATAGMTLSKKKSTLPVYIYSGSKDASIIKWDFYTGKAVHIIHGGLKPTKKLIATLGAKANIPYKGHRDHVLSMDVGKRGEYLVTGGKDNIINVWSVASNKHIKVFKHHRDAVTSLKFQKSSNQLYSASSDRSVKVWNIDDLTYVETLFGHQDQITSIDSLLKERCVTAGTRDRSLRLWKIAEESQLVFRGGGGATLAPGEDLVVMDELKSKNEKRRTKEQGLSGGSIDVVAMLDDDHFVSGSDSGAISLWSVSRKKPLFTRLSCHGPGSKVLVNGAESVIDPETVIDPIQGSCAWIVSLAAIPYTDVFASGSCDGYVKLWRLSDTKRSFTLLNSIPMTGFINSLRFFEAPLPSSTTLQQDLSEDMSATAKRILAANAHKLLASTQEKAFFLAAGVGQEHRLGRWWRLKNVENGVAVVRLG